MMSTCTWEDEKLFRTMLVALGLQGQKWAQENLNGLGIVECRRGEGGWGLGGDVRAVVPDIHWSSISRWATNGKNIERLGHPIKEFQRSGPTNLSTPLAWSFLSEMYFLRISFYFVYDI